MLYIFENKVKKKYEKCKVTEPIMYICVFIFLYARKQILPCVCSSHDHYATTGGASEAKLTSYLQYLKIEKVSRLLSHGNGSRLRLSELSLYGFRLAVPLKLHFAESFHYVSKSKKIFEIEFITYYSQVLKLPSN